jgi:NADH-quinone oxidoreductase subunit N
MIENMAWSSVWPEIILLVMTCLIAMLDLGVRSPRRSLTYVCPWPLCWWWQP